VKSNSLRVLFISVEPPENHCGVRLVMHRHLVERQPFEFLTATNTAYVVESKSHVRLKLSPLMERLRRTRFHRWVLDYENLIWPLLPNRVLDEAIRKFKPDVLLALADSGCLSQIAWRAARRHRLPLAGLFLDWFPIMKNRFGHGWSRNELSRRFRRFYSRCDLAFCTSDGMQEVLGVHPNSHVIYPMPGQHDVPEKSRTSSNGRFRLAYVGSVENFYGRMLCSLIKKFEATTDMEIIVVGPNADWPDGLVEQARARGVYLGFKPANEAAAVLADADALLVVMSFEKEHELFMRTSFTTKFLDYAAFGKPIVLWGPEFCTPVRVVRKHCGAVVVNQPEAEAVVSACRLIAGDPALREKLSQQARHLHRTLFNPDRLQGIFAGEIKKLAGVR